MKNHHTHMKQGATIASRGVVYLMAVAVFSVCGILLPELAREEAAGRAHPPTSWPFLIGAWILSAPIFIALYHIHKLVVLVEENKAFSTVSVKALQIIKVCAIVFSVLIAAAAIATVVSARIIDPTEDTPPVIMVGTIFTFVSLIVATFVAVLQRLLQDAIDLKSENDLTV